MRKRWIFCDSTTQLSPQYSVTQTFTYRLSDKETDMKDKLTPSISYLQKLGPEHLEQIFDSARWIFEKDRELAFEVG
jgi:hypothetical protein